MSSTTETSVTASATVEVEGEDVTYERHGSLEDGHAEIRVAHPGEYTVGDETVTVDEAAVYDGERIEVQLG